VRFLKIMIMFLDENLTPKHYATDSIDVIDFCKLYKLDFNKGNIIKYICRAGKKDNELEDLKKALTYLEREIDYVKKLENL